MKKILLLLTFLALLLPVAYSLTASLGNAKAILRINATPEDPAVIPRTIEVFNKNDVPVIVTLTSSINFEQFVEIIDKEFVLQPGESKKASLILTIDRGGQIEGLINVAYRSEDPTLKETPVGLSSRYVILSDGPIIEDEPETPEVEEETETVAPEVAPEETPAEEPELSEPEQRESEAQESETPEPVTTKTGPNPLVGALIVLVIILVGAGIFFVITRR